MRQPQQVTDADTTRNTATSSKQGAAPIRALSPRFGIHTRRNRNNNINNNNNSNNNRSHVVVLNRHRGSAPDGAVALAAAPGTDFLLHRHHIC